MRLMNNEEFHEHADNYELEEHDDNFEHERLNHKEKWYDEHDGFFRKFCWTYKEYGNDENAVYDEMMNCSQWWLCWKMRNMKNT